VFFFFFTTCVKQTEFILLCIYLFVAFFAPVNPQQITVEMHVQMPVGLQLKCSIFRQNFEIEMVRQFPAKFWILKFNKFYFSGFWVLTCIQTNYAERQHAKCHEGSTLIGCNVKLWCVTKFRFHELLFKTPLLPRTKL